MVLLSKLTVLLLTIPGFLVLAAFALRCKVSLLALASKFSSSCTGAYTAEAGVGVAQKTVNDSGLVDFHVEIKPRSCHEPCLRYK